MSAKCFYCGNSHDFKCPMVSAYEFDENGNVKRMEFVTFVDIMQASAEPDYYVPSPNITIS
jgi:hypothetical protein